MKPPPAEIERRERENARHRLAMEGPTVRVEAHTIRAGDIFRHEHDRTWRPVIASRAEDDPLITAAIAAVRQSCTEEGAPSGATEGTVLTLRGLKFEDELDDSQMCQTCKRRGVALGLADQGGDGE